MSIHKPLPAEISGAGGGKKSGGQSAENTLLSTATARIVELISEGPIVGLVDGAKSIYLDETPLEASDGQRNFDNVAWQQRKGEPDDEHLNGFSAVETVNAVNVEVKNDTGSVTRTITEQDADAVRVVIRVNSLFKIDDKGRSQPNSLQYSIMVRPYGGAWTEAVSQQLTNEKCTSPVQLAHRIELPVGGYPWDIRVTKLSSDSTDDKDQASMSFESFITLVEGRFTYPHTAVVALEVEAESIGESVPERAYKVMGRIISVPSNYDSYARTYAGIWDGTFKQAWTNNPAWIFYDLLRNDRYGLGEHVSEEEVALLKWRLYTIGQYCDQLIPSGYKDEADADILEHRFTFTGVIRDRKEARHALSEITTAFRGMGYWALGQVFATADMPADPVKLVTPANVIGGRFSYSSTASKARHTVAMVRFNNPNDFYRSDTELVINDEALRKHGWREKRLDFPGCTSRGLAHRYGAWVLDVENAETETVEYKASLDHMGVLPGDIIAVSDPRKASERVGGRIVSHEAIDGATDRVTFDAQVPIISSEINSIWLTTPDGGAVELPVLSVAADLRSVVIENPGFKAATNAVFIMASNNLVPRQYRVLTINEVSENEFQITALFHDPNKYARIEQGIKFEPLPYSRDTRAAKVRNLQAVDVAYIDDEGNTRTKVVLSWEAPEGVIVRDYIVQVDTPTELKRFITSTRTTLVEIEGLERANHTFYVTTVDRQGRVSSPASITHTATGTDSIGVGSVADLELADANGSTEFYGRDVRITWRNLFPISAGGAPASENTALYDFNTVRVFHAPTNTLLRTVQVRGSAFTYSYDLNQRDVAAASLPITAARALRFEITMTSKTGIETAAATLAVQNPVPQAVAPAVSAQENVVLVSLPATAATDVRGMKVWIEENASFDPGATEPKYNGTGSFVNWIGEIQKTYYVRAAYYDFFDDTANVSAPVSVTTSGASTGVAPDTPTGLALSTELMADGRARISATWVAVSAPDLAYYELLIAENGGNAVNAQSSLTSHHWTALPGTTVEVRVSAVATSGLRSSYSAIASIVAATDNVPPAVPNQPTLTASFGAIWVEWAAVADADLSHYEVCYKDSSTAPGANPTSPIIVTAAVQALIGGLGDEVTKWVFVRAVDTSGNKSNWSTGSSAETLGTPGVTTEALTGLINATSFASGIEPVTIVSSGGLPTTKSTTTIVYGGKLYRWNGSAYVTSVAAADIAGQLGAAQIAALEANKLTGQITSTQITDNAITAAKIAANTITATQIAANTLTAAQIASNAITADELAANSVQAGHITTDAVVAGKIAAGAINAREISAGAITASKIGVMDLENLWPDGTWDSRDPDIFDLSGGSVSYSWSTTALSGNTSFALKKTTLTDSVYATLKQAYVVPVRGNEKFWAEGAARIGSGSISAGFYYRIMWLDANKSFLSYTEVAANIGLSTSWTTVTAQVTAPSNARFAQWRLFNHSTNTTADTIFVDRLVFRRANAAEMIVDGAILANHLSTGELITSTAQIKNAIITEAKISGTLNANKITAGTTLSNTIIVNSQSLGTIQANANDPAARVNAASTTIQPGKITISGTTTLNDWKKGGDDTKIDGGAISANTITANKLEIGSRNITLTGIQFEHNRNLQSSSAANWLYWSSGIIRYVDDNGSTVSRSIPAADVSWSSGVVYVYWVKGESLFRTTTSSTTAFNANNVVIATYEGGTKLDADYGRTIVDGSSIKTGTITANLGIFNGSVLSGSYTPGVSGWIIRNNGTAEFADMVVRSWVKDGAVSDGVTLVNNTAAGYDNNVVVMQASLGATTLEQFWQIAFVSDFRRRGVTYTGPHYQGSEQNEYYNQYLIQTMLRLQMRTKTGSTWTGWSTIHDSGYTTSASYVQTSKVFTHHGVFDDVEIRVLALTANSTPTQVGSPGADNYITNVDDRSLVARALVR